MNRAEPSSPELWVCHLGTVPYRDALAIQQDIAARRQVGELPDTLLLLEHPPVYTRGRRSHPEELTLGEDLYRARGIEVVSTNRGGRVTYHGPGQLVGYPIMGATDVIAHLRTIEDALVAALAEEGIAARSRTQDGPDYTGVWVGDRKIASLGVHVSRGISTHGWAINVENDLKPFTWVVACGLHDVAMTSLAAELPSGHRSGMACFRKRVAYQFCVAHGRRQRLVTPQRLGIAASLAPASPWGRRTEAGRHSPSASIPISANAHAPVTALTRADDPKAKALSSTAPRDRQAVPA
jgi:lipoate-protein ligase B